MKITDDMLTEWFPKNIKPVYIGLYQRYYGDDLTEIPDYWDGSLWWICTEDGNIVTQSGFSLPWRGIKETTMTSKLTDDLLQRCRELLELNEKGESQQTALRALAATYDREIPAHDRRTMAVSQTHLEAMRALLAATQQASGEVTDYVRVPARVVELLASINRDGVIKRASELQEVYRLINAARAGEKQ
ncbi:putative bacteriophage protein [Burkholderia pseudomallei]|nr:putative bacteriophage protein [Burkholderia pseudomallei]